MIVINLHLMKILIYVSGRMRLKSGMKKKKNNAAHAFKVATGETYIKYFNCETEYENAE